MISSYLEQYTYELISVIMVIHTLTIRLEYHGRFISCSFLIF